MLVHKKHTFKTSLALYSRNDPWKATKPLLFSGNCYESRFLIGVVQQRFPYYLLLTKSSVSRLLSTVCGWFVQFDWTTTARTMQAQESLFCFQITSEPFKYFQTLSDILRYFQAGLVSRFKLKCWPMRAQILAVIRCYKTSRL